MGKIDLLIQSCAVYQELHIHHGVDKCCRVGDMEMTLATKKAICVFRLGVAARKTIAKKFPTANIAKINLTDLIKN